MVLCAGDPGGDVGPSLPQVGRDGTETNVDFVIDGRTKVYVIIYSKDYTYFGAKFAKRFDPVITDW